MAVVRTIDEKTYSLDKNKTVISDPKLRKICTAHKDDATYVPVARRTYPIDRYTIPQEIVTSQRVTSLRILKLPLLGQAGFAYFWCGRTAASMIYNWYQLIAKDGASGKDDYITHWDADQTGYPLNLRDKNGLRVFTYPADELAGGKPKSDIDSHLQCGLFVEGITPALLKANPGAKLEERKLLDYSPRDREDNGSKIAMSEKLVRERFAPAIASIDANNPVHFDTGLTTGCNHFITICGYATIVDSKGVERLWLAIANPAGPESFLNPIDLNAKGLDAIGDDTNGIVLVPGNWDVGRAEMHLIRASFFFQPKRTAFVAKKGTDDYTKFCSKYALVLDDVGNPNHEGGGMILCTQTTRVFDDAVLTKEQHCAFPLAMPGVTDCPIPALYLEESRPEDEGGFYPVGAFDNLHGGIHLPTFQALEAIGDLVAVRAIAPGRVVAARLHGGAAEDVPNDHDADEQLERIGIAREVAGNSPNFVLVRHELKLQVGSEADRAKPIVFHSLYMHLCAPGDTATKAPYGNVRWLGELNRRRVGSLVVVDPDVGKGDKAAKLTMGSAATTAELGEHLWPAEAPPARQLSEGTTTAYTTGQELVAVALKISKSADERVVLVAKDAEADLLGAIQRLDAGGVVTFPEPHQSTFVDAGTIVGYAHKASAGKAGFIHWELLSADAASASGIKQLADLAKQHLELPVEDWTETVADNLLKDAEIGQLDSKLPAADRGKHHVSEHAFAAPHAFGGSGAPITPDADHYLLKVTGKPYHSKCIPAQRTETLRLNFRGLGQFPEEKTVTLDFSQELPSAIVQAPGWASWVDVSCAGYMVRETSLALVYDDMDKRKAALAAHEKELAAHVKSIAATRWRNLRLTHLNEWNQKDMLDVLKARFEDKDGTLKRGVESLAWWGGPSTPAFSAAGAKLFTAEHALPEHTKLDNMNPIVGLWILNMLLDRGIVSFVAPAKTAPEQASTALFAGWLPATPERKPQRAGDAVRAFVVRDRERGTCKVTVQAKDTSGVVPCPIPIGKDGAYTGDSYEVGDYFSAWGKFALAVKHGAADQTPAAMGAKEIVIEAPVSSPAGAPAKIGGGRYRWDLPFSDACPARLKGYIVVWARPKRKKKEDPEAELKLIDVALPIEATEVPYDTSQARFLGAYLVAGPTNPRVEVAPGVPWSMVAAACDGKPPPKRIAKALLDGFSKLQATLAAKKVPVELVKGTLADDGLAVEITAKATKGRTAVQNNPGVLDAAKALVDNSVLTSAAPKYAAPKADDAPPTSILVNVKKEDFDDTPGGQLRVEFDPKALLGRALTAIAPAPKEEWEVQFGCRFLNGGHLLPSSSTATVEFEEREVAWKTATVEGTQLEKIPRIDFVSPSIDATIAKPMLGAVTLSRESSGVVVRAELIGGDGDFWKAAGMVMTPSGGKEKKVSGTTELKAAFQFCGKDAELAGKKFTVEIQNKNAATFHGVEVAAGSMKHTTALIDGVPGVTNVKGTPDALTADTATMEIALTADVAGISAPWRVRVSVVDHAGKAVPVVIKPQAIYPDAQGKVAATLVFKYAELAKKYPTNPETFTVSVGRDAQPEWPGGAAKGTCTLTFTPKAPGPGH